MRICSHSIWLGLKTKSQPTCLPLLRVTWSSDKLTKNNDKITSPRSIWVGMMTYSVGYHFINLCITITNLQLDTNKNHLKRIPIYRKQSWKKIQNNTHLYCIEKQRYLVMSARQFRSVMLSFVFLIIGSPSVSRCSWPATFFLCPSWVGGSTFML